MKAFICRAIQVQTHLFDRDGRQLDLPKWLKNQHTDEIDMPILLGQHHRIKTRPTRLASARDGRSRTPAESLYADAKRKGQNPSKARLALCDWNMMVTTIHQKTSYP